MDKAKFQEKKLQQALSTDKPAEKKEEVLTFARMCRVGTAWEVRVVELPEAVVKQYEKVAAPYDIYINIERKLLIEARKSDFEKWK